MKKFFHVATAFACSIGTGAQADCVRHIYNQSIMSWTVGASAANGGILISNDAGCAALSATQPGAWNVPAGCTVTVTYAQNFAIPIGVIGTLYFRGAVAASYPYYQGDFETCGRLNHSGVTAAMNLNEPADGDVQLFGQNIQSRAPLPNAQPAKTSPPKP